MPDNPDPFDDELPPYLGGRLAQSLQHHFEEFFGPGYLRQPEPTPQKGNSNEE